MPLDNGGMYRLGLAFVYRLVPVITVSILFGTLFLQMHNISSFTNFTGIYIAILCVATRALWCVCSKLLLPVST